jgi:hypothetical protein
MPPSFVGAVMPEKIDMAPPCEKPPRTMREEGMPEEISVEIRLWK